MELDPNPEAFGYLRRSEDLVHHPEIARERLLEDGYLYLPGFLRRELVLNARQSVTNSLGDEGVLDASFPNLEAVAKVGTEMYFRPDLANQDEAVQRLVYGPEVIDWFARCLGGEIRHYDFTWMRVIAHGKGTWPHCDIVYMGRGTNQLFTMWAPLGDISLDLGGLIVLEGSHKLDTMRETYGKLDVDALCENNPGKNEVEANGFTAGGAICANPVALRDELGGRWLTSEKYEMGDVLIFGMYTIHASLDNQTDFVRLSTDTRYQLASQPIDERWVGAMPGHSSAGKRQKIC